MDPALWGGTCPNDSHEPCHYCSLRDSALSDNGPRWDPKNERLATGHQSSSKINPTTLDSTLHIRAKRRYLPMFLNDSLAVQICADSGSEINYITEAFARKLGARITRRNVVFNLPTEGKVLYGYGTASIRCKFPKEPFMPQVIQFFVFKRLLCDIVVGREFLRATRTLDMYQNRLKEVQGSIENLPAIRSVGRVEEHIKCWIDGTPFLSFPDTGADINVISAGFAKQLGYKNGAAEKPIDSTERHWVELADCSSVRTEGTVHLVISFCPPSECHPSLHRIVESSDQIVSTAETGLIGKKSSIVEPFHIVNNLEFDLILGETLLATVDAYTQHDGNFEPSDARETSWIAIFKRKARGEGKSHASIPLTPEQKFKDDFSVEEDRYTREKEDVEDKERRGLISTEEARIMNFQACQRHTQWLTEHRGLLDIYHPGYYDRVVPQDIA